MNALSLRGVHPNAPVGPGFIVLHRQVDRHQLGDLVGSFQGRQNLAAEIVLRVPTDKVKEIPLHGSALTPSTDDAVLSAADFCYRPKPIAKHRLKLEANSRQSQRIAARGPARAGLVLRHGHAARVAGP
jgi:hypothetical protein